jgi:peptidoglycan/LPS O-acetylase OafA/YrhL
VRNLGLDILRLVAVLLVLGRHVDFPANAPAILQAWHVGGWVGVDLFFVLSGFLVSGLLFEEFQKRGEVRLKRFIIRRGFKIYPPLILLVVFTVLVALVKASPVSFWDVLGELAMLQNYAWLLFGGGHAGRLWDHTWSLAVEWQFYLLLVALIALMLRFRRPRADNPFEWVPVAFMGFALFCLTLRILTALRFSTYNHTWFLFGSHVRLDSLMFGVLLSYLWHFKNLRIRTAWIPSSLLLAVGGICFVPAFVFPLEEFKAVSCFGVIAFYLGSGLLLLAALRLDIAQVGFLLPLGILGAASYSIYLWHLPWKQVGQPWLESVAGGAVGSTGLLGYFAGALIVGFLMNKTVEAPALWLREKLFPSEISPIDESATQPGQSSTADSQLSPAHCRLLAENCQPSKTNRRWPLGKRVAAATKRRR